MENNSSKQVLLSVIGVAILVVAVVGVSFAFFTYTRTGTKDNVITTGTLTFAFADTNYINLTNHFPMKTSDGLALSGTDKICQFTVTGSAPQGTTVNYTVYAIEGGELTGARFQDSEVFIAIEHEDGGTTSFTPSTVTVGQDSKLTTEGVPISSLTNGVLGTGSVAGGATGQSSTFTVRMWVDSSVVSIGEGKTYTAGQYANMYYTMRIKVDANA